MPFNAIAFLLGFLPLTLAGTLAASRFGTSCVKLWLVAVSFLFYGLNAPRQLPVLLGCLVVNLVAAQAIGQARRPALAAAFGIATDLGILGWFKYLAPALWPDMPLPPGISFFVFSQIGLLLWLAASATERVGLLDQVLLSVFFPVVLAGPILNPNDMERQPTLTAETLAVGFGFFCLGLVKKTLLADPLGPIVAAGFTGPDGAVTAWFGAMAWYLQLYFDFSGYTDMAIGLAWMVGLRLPDNFDQPYRAASVIQYWQRWHMSLTRFLMANVHAPLTLAVLRRRRRLGRPINDAAQRTPSGFTIMIAGPIAATMLLAGLWHGAQWTYGLFGLLHAGYLLVNHAWRLWRLPVLPAFLAVGLTQAAVLAGAVIFRAATPDEAGRMFAAMAGGQGFGTLDLRAAATAVWLLSLFAVIWFAPTTRQFMQAGAGPVTLWRPTPRMAVAMGCLATLGLLACEGTQAFVYFSF
ncbi:MAG TPA: MBOAT family O-acyltransferase [Rhodopila sp.]|uniref:MBOAT family O-acyltransferase n=1 Tax=Rhodopila sp. TaxID=2480087 RepID=UPI002B573A3A|nr:MBOAT family O-acyltransferase [Rhodopila sp.]HVY16412.1 MBOAT family O-acyltransferase [Rhodopila sp.]